MITRTYVVKMPTSSPTTPLDILVTNSPGTQAAPVVAGTDGAYYEWLGRPLRVPVLAAAGASGGFVPRLALGFLVSITRIAAAIVTDLPGVQLSQSLASLASTDGGPTISIPLLADPNGNPAIRLVGGANTAGDYFVVTLMCPEAKDVDRDSAAGS
ncbi:MAG: hypothetical protein JO277_06105 [Candidatus Eremiobacteraeota bacterium]|nr:hypothetical protein [Candidatus Eremiobacteraeota bacterium]